MRAAPLREAVIDLAAIRHNTARLRELVGTPHLIAVVKADAYGHGAVACALAALEGGADVLGVADVREAIELRDAEISAPIVAWLHDPDARFDTAVARHVQLGVSSLAQLRAAADSAARTGVRARVHLKLDTGLSRNGVPEADWDAVFAAAREAHGAGRLDTVGLFSHVSNASEADDAAAIARFQAGLERARAAGLNPQYLHLAATAAALARPAARFNTVRTGIGLYGLSPLEGVSSADLGLRPAMTLRTRIAAVRRVAAGTGVSYDYTYRTAAETTLALVPIGYADGVPRHASNKAPVSIAGQRFRISGRVAMDQFVVDVGDAPVGVGDEVVLFGDPATGIPSADEWADACGTIHYEIVTRLGRRISRTYLGAA